MTCEWCYDGYIDGHDCRSAQQELLEWEIGEDQRERTRALIAICGQLLQRRTWISLADDLRDMEWPCWREPAVWWWLWSRVLVLRAVICLVMDWRRGRDWLPGYWIEDLWTEGDYWYWVSVGDGWWDWWAYVDRDCPDRGY